MPSKPLKKIRNTFKMVFSLLAWKIYYGLYFDNMFKWSNNYFYGAFIPYSFLSKEGKFKLYHNEGFYSCYSLLFQGIIHCHARWLYVTQIDTTHAFRLFKDKSHEYDEIFHQFFQNQKNGVSIFQTTWKDFFNKINIFKAYHNHYKYLPFKEYTVLLNTYFCPSLAIQNRMQIFTEKHSIDSQNVLAVVYRGTDKGIEVTLAPPEKYLELTQKLLHNNPHLRVLIQTDQAEVRQLFCDTFWDKCFYIEELPVTEYNIGIHKLLQDNKLDFALNFDAAIRLISQSKILIINTGNVAFFLALYRGHANNMYQFDRNWKFVDAPSIS